MSERQFKRATRQGVKPLIGFYGESGSGKTYSALLVARGIVGESGKIGMIDTESGRGSLYADVLPGGYDVMELRQPFSPAAYIEAITAAEEQKCDCLVIDSASHEWEGLGGVLDMAATNEEKSGKPGLHNWKNPKLDHARFMLRLLQSALPVIVCLRAKFKSRQTKENGRTQIVKDDHVSPIQAEDFIFEMTAHAEICHDHTIRLTKCSHPALRDCFPEDFKEPLGIKHGMMISQWASNPGQVAKPQSAKPSPDVKRLKEEIWNAGKAKYPDFKEFQQMLWDEGILDEQELLAELGVDRLTEVLRRVKAKVE